MPPEESNSMTFNRVVWFKSRLVVNFQLYFARMAMLEYRAGMEEREIVEGKNARKRKIEMGRRVMQFI